MKTDTKIKVPPIEFIKKMKDINNQNNTIRYFFFNRSKKDEKTLDWIVYERFIIYVVNDEEFESNDLIQMTKIHEIKPIIMMDKKGKEYLNIGIYCDIQNLSTTKESYNRNDNNYLKNKKEEKSYNDIDDIDDDSDFPF